MVHIYTEQRQSLPSLIMCIRQVIQIRIAADAATQITITLITLITTKIET